MYTYLLPHLLLCRASVAEWLRLLTPNNESNHLPSQWYVRISLGWCWSHLLRKLSSWLAGKSVDLLGHYDVLLRYILKCWEISVKQSIIEYTHTGTTWNYWPLLSSRLCYATNSCHVNWQLKICCYHYKFTFFTGDTLAHFNRIKQRAIHIRNMPTVRWIRYTQVSVDECATKCLTHASFDCESYTYCAILGSCFLTDMHPYQNASSFGKSPICNLYSRKYHIYCNFIHVLIHVYSLYVYQAHFYFNCGRSVALPMCLKYCSDGHLVSFSINITRSWIFTIWPKMLVQL